VQTGVRESKKKKNNPLDQSLIEENKRLKKELARLQEEAEILKKAAAYFARHQQ
jgi:transposase